MNDTGWMHFEEEQQVPSPALILHLDRIDENLRRMVTTIGNPSRLRPHLKTHKIPQLLQRQIALGITKCKAATIAEAEMAAAAGVEDILLAQQLVGPNIQRFIQLIQTFPQTRFSAICDAHAAVTAIAAAAVSSKLHIELLLDLNVGQNRTGITPDQNAAALYQLIHATPGVTCGGLHAYDGHLYQTDHTDREASCNNAFAPVWILRDRLLSVGLPIPRVVAGGSPTYQFHASRPDVECSPGTTVLWDAGYGTRLPDLPYLPAATLLTRVISHPSKSRLCLDLGHKAVASEMPHPRVVFPQLPTATTVAHNEEHLVLETEQASHFPIGTILHGIPWHICPTVALHNEAFIVSKGQLQDTWPVIARARRITI